MLIGLVNSGFPYSDTIMAAPKRVRQHGHSPTHCSASLLVFAVGGDCP